MRSPATRRFAATSWPETARVASRTPWTCSLRPTSSSDARPLPPSACPHTIFAVRASDTSLLDPIRSLGATLWLTELAPAGHARRLHVDGWISDWRHRAGEPSTAVGFAFTLEGDGVRDFRLHFHGRTSAHPEVTRIPAAFQKLQAMVKLAQRRLVLVEPLQPSM